MFILLVNVMTFYRCIEKKSTASHFCSYFLEFHGNFVNVTQKGHWCHLFVSLIAQISKYYLEYWASMGISCLQLLHYVIIYLFILLQKSI